MIHTMPDAKDAIAFDFDGTLIQNGPLNSDKGVHIIFASWYACRRTRFNVFLTPGAESLTESMVDAYIRYPGAPRFEQFSALVNALVNKTPKATPSFDGFGLDESYREAYDEARQIYNRVYSGLNDAAAEGFWKPYPAVKDFIKRMAACYDLFIASGVTQDILEEDFRRHGFERDLFCGIYGGHPSGGNHKGEILTSLKQRGYRDFLFIADSNKDLEYARMAGVKFYRIRADADYRRLDDLLPGGFPDENVTWDFEPFELDFFQNKAAHLIRRYQDAGTLPYREMSAYINTTTESEAEYV